MNKSCDTPQGPAAFQPLSERTDTLAVPPNRLNQIVAVAAKYGWRTMLRVALERSPNLLRQPVGAAPEGGRVARQVNSRARRWQRRDRNDA